MSTQTGYRIFSDTGATGPSVGDGISGGSQTTSINTYEFVPLGTGVVDYPSTVGAVSGTFYYNGLDYYFVPDDPTGFPPNEAGTTTSFSSNINGTTGNDTLTGTSGDDVIYDTDENIYSSTGSDSINGGAGADTIIFGDGNDTINGGAGDDVIGDWATGAGNNTLSGGGGDDTIIGGSGNDQIWGDDGDDWLSGNLGDDTIYGGGGRDEIWVTDDHNSLTAYGGESGVDWDILGFGNFASTQGVAVTVSGFEAGSFSFVGTATSGTFFEIEEVISTEYADTIDGGSATNDMLVYGLGGDDSVVGGIGADRLFGGFGQDTLEGGVGNDEVYGQEGNDQLSGGAGNDTITGDSGSDTLTGGSGNDDLSGGSGNDTFVFSDGSGDDTIQDFDLGDSDSNGFTNDQLDLSGLTDGAGNPVRVNDIVVSDVGGNAVLTFPNGESITLNGIAPAAMTSSQMVAMGVPCFTGGTLIATPRGDVPVDTLRPGDLVQTADNGVQPVLWIGRRDVGASELRHESRLRPVLIRAGTLGNARDMLVSRQHAMLLRHPEQGEVLARAIHLARHGGPGFRVANGVRQISYFHLLFEAHQIIFAEGAPSESFYPGPQGLASLDPANKQDVLSLFPELTHKQARGSPYGPTARDVIAARDLDRHWVHQRPLGPKTPKPSTAQHWLDAGFRVFAPYQPQTT